MSTYDEQLEIHNATKAAKGKSVNYRLLENGLKKRLSSEKITQDDVNVAYDVARQLQSEASRVLYSRVKRAAAQQETE